MRPDSGHEFFQAPRRSEAIFANGAAECDVMARVMQVRIDHRAQACDACLTDATRDHGRLAVKPAVCPAVPQKHLPSGAVVESCSAQFETNPESSVPPAGIDPLPVRCGS